MNCALDETYEKVGYLQSLSSIEEFDNCSFNNTDFSEVELFDIRFSDCVFKNCDFTMAKFINVSLNGCKFEGCKIVGTNFLSCNKLGLSIEFTDSKIDYSIFIGLPLAHTKFTNCSIIECDFSEAKLSNSEFIDCDLSRSIFHATNLQNANLSTSYNFQINPNTNQIKGAKFSHSNIAGLLTSFGIKIE